MSKKGQISFIAQHRRGSVVFFPLFPFAAAIGLLIALLATQEKSQFVVLLILIIFLTAFSICLLVFFLIIFIHKLVITEDEIILKGITGIIRQYKKTDIERIVFRSSYRRSGIPYLIIQDKLSVNKRTDSIMNKKNEFIKLDCNKERIEIIIKFWHGDIEGLPEKYKN